MSILIGKSTIYVRGGDAETIDLILRVADRLRREYGINVYIETLGFDPWLIMGAVPSDYNKIIVGDKEIDLNMASEDAIISEILTGLASGGMFEEEMSLKSSDHDRFSSGEYLLTEVETLA
ncbi:MAG: hypothetical protein F7B95_00445 [Desulfurococcales archaeon]|nr:hypothetical protein [Desulfurococcales archaeon]